MSEKEMKTRITRISLEVEKPELKINISDNSRNSWLNLTEEPMKNYIFITSFILILFFFVFAQAKEIAKEKYMTIFYNHDQIAKLVKDGGTVDSRGVYNVWLWAKEGSNVYLKIDDKDFIPTHTDTDSEEFSWVNVGKVELEAGKKFSVEIDVLHGYFDFKPELIGQMVLTEKPKFHPKYSFEMMRVFTDSAENVDDKRISEIRCGEGMTYTFPTYQTKEEWLKRAEYLRKHILVSTGLYPMPEKTPLNAQVFGKIEHEDYTVEKVYFESYPGFFVTGNLYRPKGKKEPFPAVVCPHGHWSNGRLEDQKRGSVPGRCINFAKQGYVAFSYDMVGYNDSGKQIEHRNILTGKREELWGLGVMALQLWNSIRSVDFISSLEDVDAERIACTGASGGGTQTYMLTAVDDRVKVSAPVCMISAHYQGGCNCENIANLRVNTYNVEIGALMAPRPIILVSATGDWTKNTPEVEYPDIRSIYQLFNADEKIKEVQFDAEHNYNRNGREAVYKWFGQWMLGVDDETKLKEECFEVEEPEELLVFHDRELPDSVLDKDELVEYLIESAKRQIQEMKPTNQDELEEFKDIMFDALLHSLSAEIPDSSEVVVSEKGMTDYGDFTVRRLIIGRKDKGDQIPSILFVPKDTSTEDTTLVIHPEGKAALVDAENSEPVELIKGLLENGHKVLTIDCFLTGEFHIPFEKTERNKDVNFFTTFNRTDTALRVQDILTGLTYLQNTVEENSRDCSINLVGLEDAGLLCLLARGIATGLDKTIADVSNFDTDDDEQWIKRLYIPDIRRVGGLNTAMTLATPNPLFIYNTGENFQTDWISQVYSAVNAENSLKIESQKANESEIIEWLK